jgi:hypothetical protein
MQHGSLNGLCSTMSISLIEIDTDSEIQSGFHANVKLSLKSTVIQLGHFPATRFDAV